VKKVQQVHLRDCADDVFYRWEHTPTAKSRKKNGEFQSSVSRRRILRQWSRGEGWTAQRGGWYHCVKHSKRFRKKEKYLFALRVLPSGVPRGTTGGAGRQIQTGQGDGKEAKKDTGTDALVPRKAFSQQRKGLKGSGENLGAA